MAFLMEKGKHKEKDVTELKRKSGVGFLGGKFPSVSCSDSCA